MRVTMGVILQSQHRGERGRRIFEACWLDNPAYSVSIRLMGEPVSV